MAANANPLWDMVITDAITIVATLAAESSQPVSASRPITAAAAAVTATIWLCALKTSRSQPITVDASSRR